MSDEPNERDVEARLMRVTETVATLLRFDCLEDRIPSHIDVPDDYESGIHDAAKSVRAALRGDA